MFCEKSLISKTPPGRSSQKVREDTGAETDNHRPAASEGETCWISRQVGILTQYYQIMK